MDGDGDTDFVAVAGTGTSEWPPRLREVRLSWLENVDGRGAFIEHRVSSQDVGSRPGGRPPLTVADIDNDNDMDVISAAFADGTIEWHENRLLGDTDDNGVVEFADFLAVSANFGTTRPA